MSVTVFEVNCVVERLWPLTDAADWDAPGLLSGAPSAVVNRVHLAVDAVSATVAEAIDVGADLLLVHHPLLMRGVTSISEDRPKGALLSQLIRANCALIAAHTNADVVSTGTSAVFAGALGLSDQRPLVATTERGAGTGTGTGTGTGSGFGRVGVLPTPLSLGRLARQLGALLPATAGGIRVSGEYDAPISTVAICGGAGDSLLGNPEVLASDVYITSDLRHHPASEFREAARLSQGPALIDVSHWASEWLWLSTAAAELQQALPQLTITVSDLRTDPWDFVITQ